MSAMRGGSELRKGRKWYTGVGRRMRGSGECRTGHRNGRWAGGRGCERRLQTSITRREFGGRAPYEEASHSLELCSRLPFSRGWLAFPAAVQPPVLAG